MNASATRSWLFRLAVLAALSGCDSNLQTGRNDTSTGTSTSTSTGTNTNTNNGDASVSDLAHAVAQKLFDYPHVPTFQVRLPQAEWGSAPLMMAGRLASTPAAGGGRPLAAM